MVPYRYSSSVTSSLNFIGNFETGCRKIFDVFVEYYLVRFDTLLLILHVILLIISNTSTMSITHSTVLVTVIDYGP